MRTQHTRFFPARSITRQNVIDLYSFLIDFKKGLPTTNRLIKADISGERICSHKESSDVLQILEPYNLSDVKQLILELRLDAESPKSCELHIEFNQQNVFVSVSDIETGWGDAVINDFCHFLKERKLVSGYFFLRLSGILFDLQNILLILSSTLFLLWYIEKLNGFLWASLGMLVTGIVPIAKSIYARFVPPSKHPVIQENKSKYKIPWGEIIIIISFLTAVISFVKELLR